MSEDKKKPLDLTSKKSCLEYGIIGHNGSFRLKDPEKVIRDSAERMRKVFEEAERLAREYERRKSKSE